VSRLCSRCLLENGSAIEYRRNELFESRVDLTYRRLLHLCQVRLYPLVSATMTILATGYVVSGGAGSAVIPLVVLGFIVLAVFIRLAAGSADDGRIRETSSSKGAKFEASIGHPLAGAGSARRTNVFMRWFTKTPRAKSMRLTARRVCFPASIGPKTKFLTPPGWRLPLPVVILARLLMPLP